MSADRTPPGSLEELIVRYWDDALAPEELAELNRLLATSEDARTVFQQFSVQTLSIGEHFAVQRAAAAAEVARPARWSAVRAAPAAIVALLILVAVVVVVRRERGEGVAPEPAIARLDDLTGTVRVSSGEGEGTPARLKQPLHSGQTVSVSGNEGTAEVRFSDGTRLLLNGDAAVQIAEDERKRVRVFRGNLAADVRPQPPGRPMMLTTPDTEVEVLGTKLSLSETAQRTEVAVVHGEVRVTRLSDRQSMDLHSGQVATAIKGSKKLLLSRLPDLPDAYALSFEPLPPDWGAGQPIRDGLPPGSAVGMRAGPFHSRGFGTQYQVRSQNAWTSGLFTIHEDSWLHLRFRFERTGFFHVLFVARGDDPTNKRAVVFEAPQVWRKRAPGEWHEASVPLGKAKRIGPSPPEFQLPLVVYTVVVNSHLEDIGLAVDRLRVTRGPAPH